MVERDLSYALMRKTLWSLSLSYCFLCFSKKKLKGHIYSECIGSQDSRASKDLMRSCYKQVTFLTYVGTNNAEC